MFHRCRSDKSCMIVAVYVDHDGMKVFISSFRSHSPQILTAGNSLFHVIVDTDETASKVLDVMPKERTSRVTFMPLNRLKQKTLKLQIHRMLSLSLKS
ncbi:hypothetical protein BYT27DRAFT_6769534 [Phlegmacium glaucopus]|nr:hypothetical protein BYT27DRAFT_6769534 [Phlegmacium glaucopus]